MAKSLTLGKKERLKSRKTIDSLFSKGKSFAVAPFRAYYLFGDQPGKDILQFGAGVSSRHFKKAVHRNRIKRLLREAWRLQKNTLKERLQSNGRPAAIFIIYTGKELPAYDLVFNKLSVILNKLTEIADENISPHT